jgi:hypothetical protein
MTALQMHLKNLEFPLNASTETDDEIEAEKTKYI